MHYDDPYKNLCQAVLIRAVKDILCVVEIKKCSSGKKKELQRIALDWINNKIDDDNIIRFDLICEALEIDERCIFDFIKKELRLIRHFKKRPGKIKKYRVVY